MQKNNCVVFETESLIRYIDESHEYFLNIDGIEYQCEGVSHHLDSLKNNDFEYAPGGTCKSLHARIEYWSKHYKKFPERKRERAMRAPLEAKGLGFTESIWPLKYDAFISQERLRELEKHWDGTDPMEDLNGIPFPHGNGFTKEHVEEAWILQRNNGTELHKEIEMFKLYDEMPTIWTTKFLQFLQFNEDYKHVNWIRFECRLCDPTALIAGTGDAFSMNPDGTITVWDWKGSNKFKSVHAKDDTDAKSSKKFYPPLGHLRDTARNKYTLQLNWYAHFVELCGYKVTALNIVVFHEFNESYIVIPMDNTVRKSAPFQEILRKRRQAFEQLKLFNTV